MASVPLAVTVEIRALDTGTRVVRAFRVTRELDDRNEITLRFESDLPFEPGRPVSAELTLPDGSEPIVVTGVAAPAAVVIRAIDADARRRIAAYLTERTRTP